MVTTTSCLSSFQLLQSFKEQSFLVVAKGLTWLKVGKRMLRSTLSYKSIKSVSIFSCLYLVSTSNPPSQASQSSALLGVPQENQTNGYCLVLWHHCQATYIFLVLFFFLLFVFHTFNAFFLRGEIPIYIVFFNATFVQQLYCGISDIQRTVCTQRVPFEKFM